MEDFVTYEQAKALKKLGFDWEVFFQFNYKTKEIKPNTGASYSEGGPFDTYDVLEDVTKYGCIPAPTLSQVQKWLREKGIFLYVNPLCFPSFSIFKYIIDRTSSVYRIESEPQFESYEQALSAGIDSAIALLKQESK